MQIGTADIMARELLRHLIDGAADETQTLGIPALQHLAWAIREQRVTDGYRRLLRAIVDESWTSDEG